MGRLLCSGFLGNSSHDKPYVFLGDAKQYRGETPIDDSALAVAIRDELEAYDMIVGHNIRMFDIPFLNARLAKADERPLRRHFILDTLYYVGYQQMRIGSKKLDNVQKFFSLGEEKTPITWEDWQLAAQGDKRAMDRVVTHNIQDVKVLKELYPHILPYVANLHR
jgi:uncharacterized protein YprB with RNaseH-like and TPR domain